MRPPYLLGGVIGLVLLSLTGRSLAQDQPNEKTAVGLMNHLQDRDKPSKRG
jgi:hypothetical protein